MWVVDCSNLDHISSAGLRVLLTMQKKTGVELEAVSESVKEIHVPADSSR